MIKSLFFLLDLFSFNWISFLEIGYSS